jgi:hypothetical protein
MKKNWYNKKNEGQAMMLFLTFFLFISLTIVVGIVTPVVKAYGIASDSLESRRSYYMAESGVDDVLYRVKNAMTVSGSETLVLGTQTATTTLTDLGNNVKQIETLGDVKNRERSVAVRVETSDGISFSYGVYVGTGGLTMSGSTRITGNVSSNGPIVGNSSSYITGSAISTGPTGSITGGGQWNQFRVGTVSGIAQAHTTYGVNVTGALYCQTGTQNNKACNTTLPDAPVQAFPITDAHIQEWKDAAVLGGTHAGNYSLGGSSTASIGPKKINGNLTVNGSGVLTVTGTLHVTGNLSVSGAGIVKLASSYGASSDAIIVDGTVTIAGSSPINGSGSAGSYILVLSNSTSSSAINISGAAGAVILVAPNGTLTFSGSASAKEAMAKTMSLSGATNVTYETGLIDPNFSSGPSGTYVVQSWGETE